MFIYAGDKNIRYTGRWKEQEHRAVSTAQGSYLEFMTDASEFVLHFDTTEVGYPHPHLYVIFDDTYKVETPIDRYMRFEFADGKPHHVKIISKGAMEMQSRWSWRLESAFILVGIEIDRELLPLPEDNRKTIEFVGDSITEGVVIDENRRFHSDDQKDRPLQDDATATYAYLTAQNLNLRPYIMGYGAVGVTHGGCGWVPKVAEAYPFNFSGAPVTYKSPDFIVFNHGTNDRFAEPELFEKEYIGALDVIREKNPTSKLIALTPFCGVFDEAIEKIIKEYNEKNNTDIFYIGTKGWISPEPIHPDRTGHKTVAEKLSAILKERFGL